MIERWRHEWGARDDGGPADLTARLFVGWRAYLMLLGWRLERHPREWTLEVYAGPLCLSIERVGSSSLPRIIDGLHDDEECESCHGEGLVCEAHPDRPWDAGYGDDCGCGAPGMPCPKRPGA